jgi:hypothetical protein
MDLTSIASKEVGKEARNISEAEWTGLGDCLNGRIEGEGRVGYIPGFVLSDGVDCVSIHKDRV